MEFLNEDIPKCSHCSHYVVTKIKVSDYAKTLIYQGYTTTVVTNTYILYIKYINIWGKGVGKENKNSPGVSQKV